MRCTELGGFSMCKFDGWSDDELRIIRELLEQNLDSVDKEVMARLIREIKIEQIERELCDL